MLSHWSSDSRPLHNAVMVFDEIPVKSISCQAALKLRCGWRPCTRVNFFFFRCFKLYIGLFELGRQFHGYVIRKVHDMKLNFSFYNLLFEMYDKVRPVYTKFTAVICLFKGIWNHR